VTPEITIGIVFILVNIGGWAFALGKGTQKLNSMCTTVKGLCEKVDIIVPQVEVLQVKVERLENDRYGERSKKHTEAEGSRTP